MDESRCNMVSLCEHMHLCDCLVVDVDLFRDLPLLVLQVYKDGAGA